MSNASRFKLHDVLSGECCALSCDAPASKQFASPVPLCDLHLLRVYKSVNRQMKAAQAKNQEYELFSLPGYQLAGPCPACGHAGYLDKTDADGIRCRNESCRYQADAEAFENAKRKALFDLADGRSVVYYIGFRDLVKIGTTVNLRRRWKTLNMVDSLLGFEYGDRRQEAQRHKQFWHHRFRGEWFLNTAQLRAHINDVAVIS